MSGRLASIAACVVVVVLWSSTEAGAQTCPDATATPHATSEHVEFTGLIPGQRRSWPTTVTNTYDDPVAVRASLDGTGDLSSALRIGLRTCAVPWQPTGGGSYTCPTGASVVLAPTLLDGGDGVDVDLPTLAASASLHVLFDAELPSSTGNELQGAVGSVRSLMVWQQQCGPAPTAPTTAPPTTGPTTGPTTAPTTPTAVPVTVPPSSTPTTIDRPGDQGDPRAGSPRGRGPGRPEHLPFTGAPTTATLLVAAGLLVAGAAALVAGYRRRRGDEEPEA